MNRPHQCCRWKVRTTILIYPKKLSLLEFLGRMDTTISLVGEIDVCTMKLAWFELKMQKKPLHLQVAISMTLSKTGYFQQIWIAWRIFEILENLKSPFWKPFQNWWHKKLAKDLYIPFNDLRRDGSAPWSREGRNIGKKVFINICLWSRGKQRLVYNATLKNPDHFIHVFK